MRLVSTLILLVVFSNSFFGQAYEHMLKEGRFWDEWHRAQGPVENYEYFYRYSLKGDTTVNGKKYFKVVSYGKGNGLPPSIEYFSNYSFTGTLMREDTVTKKIWKLDVDSISEDLLYNFSMNVGDTMFVHSEKGLNDSVIFCVLDSTGITTLKDNTQRRVYYYRQFNTIFNGTYTVTEGVGGEQGFLAPFRENYFETRSLICFKEMQEILWGQTSIYNLCGNFVGVNEHKSRFAFFTVSPNPSFGKNILIEGDGIETVRVYNIQGQLVDSYQVNDQNSIGIETALSGIYLVQVRFTNGEQKATRVVVY